VAPFRAFLQERAAWLQRSPGAPPAPCYLFFGCRSPHADFYYQAEWRELQRLGVLDRQAGLVTAFSRAAAEGGAGAAGAAAVDGAPGSALAGSAGAAAASGAAGGEQGAAATAAAGGGGKVYVTHRLREHAELVWDLLARRSAVVYVSGSAQKMPGDVAAALADVAARQGAMGREAGAKWVRQLELAGRSRVEAWS